METGFRCGQLLSCYFQKKSRFTLLVSYPKKKISAVCRFSLFCFEVHSFLALHIGLQVNKRTSYCCFGWPFTRRETERETERERQRQKERETERE